METKFLRTLLVFLIIFITESFLVSFSYQEEDFTIEENGIGFSIVQYQGTRLKVAVPAIYRGKKITAIDGYQSNGKGAFQNSEITEVVLSEGIQNIGFWSFGSCQKLVQIKLPKSLASIGSYAFMDCKNLEKITIPERVTSIGNYVFYGCSKLSEVIIEATVPPSLENMTNNLFSNSSPSLIIRVPSQSLNDYVNTQGWAQYSAQIVRNKEN